MNDSIRLISWNINGIRAAVKKGFVPWWKSSGAEIIALQEVRARQEQVPQEVRERKGWNLTISTAERAGYSGVALLGRRIPDELVTTLGEERFDAEGRFMLARYGALYVANIYFPNGSGRDRDNSRIPYKLDFYQKVFSVLKKRRAKNETDREFIGKLIQHQ